MAGKEILRIENDSSIFLLSAPHLMTLLSPTDLDSEAYVYHPTEHAHTMPHTMSLNKAARRQADEKAPLL